jgi:hypothetical protein
MAQEAYEYHSSVSYIISCIKEGKTFQIHAYKYSVVLCVSSSRVIMTRHCHVVLLSSNLPCRTELMTVLL